MKTRFKFRIGNEVVFKNNNKLLQGRILKQHISENSDNISYTIFANNKTPKGHIYEVKENEIVKVLRSKK